MTNARILVTGATGKTGSPGVAHTIVNPGIFPDAYLVMTGVAAHLGVLPLRT